ncbi:MAG: sigma-54 dependent transcriptional regulator [Planctomycetota bacterium]|nr:sigma-54 dependent transcriptional regulator [Planctomycetota bacterium]
MAVLSPPEFDNDVSQSPKRMTQQHILIVDDEPNARGGLQSLLRDEGYAVAVAENGMEGIDRATELCPDVILCDLKMPVLDGMGMLQKLREKKHPASFIIMTAFGTVQTAVAAMKLGADDYLTKPLNFDELQIVLERTLERRALELEMEILRKRLKQKFSVGQIVGSSPQMQRVFKLLEQVAPTTATVLILGETGTGKELIAEAIHENSDRAAGPFIKVNCSALAESLLESELFGHEKGSFTGADARRKGKFEIADGGTLFLDEIGEVSLGTQVKLLRFLQEREFERVGGNEVLKVDVRVIAAANRDLKAAIEDNEFREDLYYRLNVISLEMPPLRDRLADLQSLVEHFIEKYARRHNKTISGIEPHGLHRMMAYRWPGNIRELENVVERAVVLALDETIKSDQLPAFLPEQPEQMDPDLTPPIPGASLKELERYAIVKTLEQFEGHRAKSAAALGISVRALQYKLKEYGLLELD